MNIFRIFVLFVLALVWQSSRANAEIYKCNGKWTNQLCDDGAEVVLPEKKSALVEEEESEKDSVGRP
jgi:hypothetical protein